MERREAPALRQRSAARRKTGAPLGAPSPRLFARGKRNDGVPAPLKNRGDDACALSYPSPARGGSAPTGPRKARPDDRLRAGVGFARNTPPPGSLRSPPSPFGGGIRKITWLFEN